MKKYHVYGIGNAIVDIEVLVEPDFFDRMEIEKGVMSLVERPRQSKILDELKYYNTKKCCGGSAANTLISMAQLGAKTFYSCKVSNDKWGSFYTRDLVGHGVATNLLDDRPEGTTATCVVMVTPDADRTMNTHLGISKEFSANEIVESELIESEWFYIEGYLLQMEIGVDAALKGVEIARKNGVKIAITLSDKSVPFYEREALMKVIGEGVDMIFCNFDEARAFSNTDNINDCVSYMSKYSKEFCITLGGDGAVIYDGNSVHRVYTDPVKAVDTLGAGDVFAGSFMYAYVNNFDYDVAGKFACKVAAQLCAQYGTRLPDEVLLDLKKKYLKK